MHLYKFYKLVVLLTFSILLGCAKKDAIHVNIQHPEFDIRLPANPTTGFLWTVENYDKQLFSLENNKYLSAKSRVMGAGGTRIFTFKLLKSAKYPRVSRIKFKHSRSWEPKSAVYKEVKIVID